MGSPRNTGNFTMNRCISNEYSADFLSGIFYCLSFNIYLSKTLASLQKFSLVVCLECVSKITVPGIKSGPCAQCALVNIHVITWKFFPAYPERHFMQIKFQIGSAICLPPQSLLKKLLQEGEERTFSFLSQVPKKQKSTFSIHARSLWERFCQL